MGGMVTPACKQATWAEPHDLIGLQISNCAQQESEVLSFYKNGLSLRDIENRIGYSKSKVRDILIRAEIPLRKRVEENRRATQGIRAKKNAKPPYGFCYFEGRAVVNPKEYSCDHSALDFRSFTQFHCDLVK